MKVNPTIQAIQNGQTKLKLLTLFKMLLADMK